MSNSGFNKWKAMIVLSSDHQELLRPFALLEDEILGTLNQLNKAHEVREYLISMELASREWLKLFQSADRNK